jgi:cytochrome c
VKSSAPALAVLLLAVACGRTEARHEAESLTHGDAERGRTAIRRYGCGTCHVIPGVRGANATVGPPLENLYSRTYLAGQIGNSAPHLILWIRHPQQVEPKTAMPDMAVTERDARDIAAYLYTLR